MTVFQVIFSNLLGYDLLIFAVAAGNAVLYSRARSTAAELYRKLHRDFYLPSRQRDPEQVAAEMSTVDEERIVALRKHSEDLYSLFANVTSIFPLLGILGTVVSLLPMVSNLSDMQTNFFAALTSTFWGLVFAILFKFLDGFLASRMDDHSRSVELLLARRTGSERTC